MTAARQPEKPALKRFLAGLVLAFGLVRAAAAEPLVVNAETGLALSGYDPVAYFTNRQPELGKAGLEITVDGAVWRFRNVGNQAAFKDHPEVYRPRFGGYDPVGVARKRSVPGNPLFWAIRDEKLYLFYSDKDRRTFLAAPARVLEAAERRWPDVQRTIGR
jgi:hypothetical protein